MISKLYRGMSVLSGRPQGIVQRMASIVCVFVVLLASICDIAVIHAATAYHVALTTSNFPLQALSASADDLSNSSHALFSLHNGTQLWYSVSLQSSPAGLTPIPTNPASDIVTNTFYNAIPLLPPAGVLPFDQRQAGQTSSFESLNLAVAFSGPGQQVQLDLNPFESHAVTLDLFTMMLQVLGEQSAGAQIGLLAPGGLKALFDAASTMKDFESLVNDYTQVLQTTGNAINNTTSTVGALVSAFACAKDLVALLSDGNEQQVLVDLLWKLLGKAVLRDAITRTLTSFVQAQFGLGIEGFLNDEALVIDSVQIGQSDPTVLVQSVANTSSPTSTPTPTQQTPKPSATKTSKPIPSPLPSPSPTVTTDPTPFH